MKVNQKHFFICLLLISLFLTSYISVLNTNGIISSDTNASDVSFSSGGSRHSLMDGGTNFRHLDYISAISIEFFNFSSIKNTRPLAAKTIFDILTALIAAQIVCLIYSSRLSKNICTEFNSIRIIFFLHKKDGMK
jgi:hypothetical protein